MASAARSSSARLALVRQISCRCRDARAYTQRLSGSRPLRRRFVFRLAPVSFSPCRRNLTCFRYRQSWYRPRIRGWSCTLGIDLALGSLRQAPGGVYPAQTSIQGTIYLCICTSACHRQRD